MRNIKLTIEYDGSRYQGWTRLGKDESGNTISNKITEVLKKMTAGILGIMQLSKLLNNLSRIDLINCRLSIKIRQRLYTGGHLFRDIGDDLDRGPIGRIVGQ